MKNIKTVVSDKVIEVGPSTTIGEVRSIQAASAYDSTVLIGGVEYQRVRYGDEADDWGADERPCPDCGVSKGQVHVMCCDVERCPLCEGQMISCNCDYESDIASDTLSNMSEDNTNAAQPVRMARNQRYELACAIIKNSPTLLRKTQIEKQAGIRPFNEVRWFRFQEKFQDEIVVHPVTKKVHWIGSR